MTSLIDSLPPPARTASRPSVSYEAYVRDYAKMAAWYVILATGGIASISGAIVYEISGLLMVLTIATGLAIALGGLAGFAAAATAHNSYTKLLALSTVTTYQAPPAPPPTIRPVTFIPSSNGQKHSNTIRVGRFRLPPALFESVNGDGRITRDGAIKSGMARELYRDWQATIGELARLGIVDGAGRVTDEGWRVYRESSPRPVDQRDGAGAQSTPARPGARPPGVQS